MAEQQQNQGVQPAAATAPTVPGMHFVPKHNQIVLLDEEILGAAAYAPIMQFLRRSRIFYSTRSTDNTIEVTTNGNQIAITQDVICAALRFGDLDHCETCYSRPIRERAAVAFGYMCKFPSKQLVKGMIIGQWRYFFHVLMQRLAPRKLGMDDMVHSLLLGMIGLTFNQPFNFSLMIIRSF
ncbi:hypothetical protein Hanom_Chr16g01467891 [Helianthus anomalus]